AAQLMLKDLGLAVDAAQQVDQPVVLGSMVQKLYRQLCQDGHAHLDFSSIMHQYTTPPV
ncbi:MAG: NAD-binding protein, partial [Acinetobacter sp.]